MKKSICTRILLIVISLLIMASMVACAGEPDPTTIPDATTVPTEPTESVTLLPPVTPNRVSYKVLPSGVVRRNLTIKAGIGEQVVISQITDAHLNSCTEEDLLDPVLASTYQYRTWKKDNASLPNLQNTMTAAAKDSDLIVLTGDIYDYLSQGAINTVQEHVFGKYSNIMACLGNHEIARQMEGKVSDTMPMEQIREKLSAGWCNDITYASQILKDKVMVIVMDNGSSHFFAEQIPLLEADLQKARVEGLVVLVFYHIPMLTGDHNDNQLKADSKYNSKNSAATTYDFGTEVGHNFVGKQSTGADKEIYDVITNNGDIIYGLFCGHIHGDWYTEIKAKTASGEAVKIPQYMIQGCVYDKGHFLQIIIE